MTADLDLWRPRERPSGISLSGDRVRLDSFQADLHAQDLFAAICGPENTDLWDWILIGPYESPGDLAANLTEKMDSGEWLPYVIFDHQNNTVLGMFSFMRIREEVGSVELGGVVYSKKLQRTAAATEAFYLMARHIFEDLGYRRFEWKCNSQNDASARSARRYGFTYEGRFRQDVVWRKGNRDTDWYSMLDHEWLGIKTALDVWLSPKNFDVHGQQVMSLTAMRQK